MKKHDTAIRNPIFKTKKESIFYLIGERKKEREKSKRNEKKEEKRKNRRSFLFLKGTGHRKAEGGKLKTKPIEEERRK